MTSTGLRNPGSDPRGSGRSAHQISPRVTDYQDSLSIDFDCAEASAGSIFAGSAE